VAVDIFFPSPQVCLSGKLLLVLTSTVGWFRIPRDPWPTFSVLPSSPPQWNLKCAIMYHASCLEYLKAIGAEMLPVVKPGLDTPCRPWPLQIKEWWTECVIFGRPLSEFGPGTGHPDICHGTPHFFQMSAVWYLNMSQSLPYLPFVFFTS
jgi:hypothetical protein